MSRHPFELEQWECESLLRSHVVGRVGLVAEDGPHVIPVNYSVVDEAIVFRTTPYGLLGTVGRDSTLAFEIDQFDHERQRGWSVLARGPSEAVDDRDELAHIESVWPPQPWASGARQLHIRLRWTHLSGRKLGSGWDPGRASPVHRTL
jgi:uncharacterized protein